MTGYTVFNSPGIPPWDGYQLINTAEKLNSRNMKLRIEKFYM